MYAENCTFIVVNNEAVSGFFFDFHIAGPKHMVL